MTGWWFLGVSAYGALYTVNAYRPFRLGVTVIPAFFAHWLTSELAIHHIVWQAVATAIFVRLGALDSPAGWLGLGITTASWIGLVGLFRRARASAHEIEAALQEGLGRDYRNDIDEDLVARHDPRLSPYRLVTAFHFGHRDVEKIRNLAFGPYGRRNRLDVYRHREAPAGAPVLLWIHGGGWVIGHKAQQALPMMHHLASHGWVCVSANYRLSPRASFPDHLVDVKRAIAWTHEHIAEYGGDPTFVVISGGSAGGHLSSLAALTAGRPEFQPDFEDADTSVQAAIPLYGVYDFTNRFGHRPGLEGRGYQRFLERTVMKRSLADDPDAFAQASPYDQIHAQAPPFFVIHGTHDLLAPVGDAREFVRHLREVSAEPVAYAELAGTQHAFEIFHTVRAGHVIRGIERFGDWAWSRHRARETDHPLAAEG